MHSVCHALECTGHIKRIRATEMAMPLGGDLFGDKVSLYNGSTVFSVTDIDLPGNHSLPVRLSRRFKVESKKQVENLGGFGAWDIDVPFRNPSSSLRSSPF